MVKIRLRRIGTKGRPFYRVVVAKSTSGRNGAFVETLGQYDPVVKPTLIVIDEARALHWLNEGAQPTETTAFLLSKVGILDKFFEQRPTAKKKYGFLDKRTAAISVRSAVSAPEPVADAPMPEQIAEAPVEQSQVAEEVRAPELEMTAESPAVEEPTAVAEAPASVAAEIPTVEPEGASKPATADEPAPAEATEESVAEAQKE